jgi:hypothetical protein
MSESTAAELSVTAEHVDHYGKRLAELARPLVDGRPDEAAAAIYEAERALRNALRHLVRATRLLRR